MTANQAVKILSTHAINYRVTDDKILAEDVYYSAPDGTEISWIDVTNWTCNELYQWLGY